jgi:hypothetical protein
LRLTAAANAVTQLFGEPGLTITHIPDDSFSAASNPNPVSYCEYMLRTPLWRSDSETFLFISNLWRRVLPTSKRILSSAGRGPSPRIDTLFD